MSMIRELWKPLFVLAAVTCTGWLLLCYSLAHTAGANAQTGGGTMGPYELNFIQSKNESYVTLTSYFFDKRTVSYSNDSLAAWRIYNPSFIWHFNKQAQAWELVPPGK